MQTERLFKTVVWACSWYPSNSLRLLHQPDFRSLTHEFLWNNFLNCGINKMSYWLWASSFSFHCSCFHHFFLSLQPWYTPWDKAFYTFCRRRVQYQTCSQPSPLLWIKLQALSFIFKYPCAPGSRELKSYLKLKIMIQIAILFSSGARELLQTVNIHLCESC